MSNKKNKMIASVLALAMVAANAASLPVDAATIPTIETDFEYELKAEIISQSQIKLTFYTTVNPGVQELGLALLHDPGKFTAVDSDLDSNFQSSISMAEAYNPETGVYILALSVNPDFLTGASVDYEDNFYVSIYLNAKDGNATDEDLYEFSAAVVDYKSLTEDVTMDSRLSGDANDSYVPEVSPPEIEIEASPAEAVTYTHMLGDTDLNGVVNLSDVTCISSLIAAANASYESNKVANLNDLISNYIVYTLSDGRQIKWGGAFDNFLITLEEENLTFSCVEICDADQNGMVEQEDADKVADYYSALASNMPVDELFNTPMTKTIYIE